MRQRESALRAFISEKFPDADENVMRAIVATVSLEEGEPDEAEETRVLKIKQDTDDKTTAESIKLYNLMKVSYHDLWGFLLKESTILLTEDNRTKVIMSLLNLLFEFYPKLKVSFNEQDARVLLSIYTLGSDPFTAENVTGAYRQRFGETVTTERVSRSLNYLDELRVLKYIGDGRYIARERVIYER